jgi:hypothetical protein
MSLPESTWLGCLCPLLSSRLLCLRRCPPRGRDEHVVFFGAMLTRAMLFCAMRVFAEGRWRQTSKYDVSQWGDSGRGEIKVCVHPAGNQTGNLSLMRRGCCHKTIAKKPALWLPLDISYRGCQKCLFMELWSCSRIPKAKAWFRGSCPATHFGPCSLLYLLLIVQATKCHVYEKPQAWRRKENLFKWTINRVWQHLQSSSFANINLYFTMAYLIVSFRIDHMSRLSQWQPPRKRASWLWPPRYSCISCDSRV